MILVFEQQPVPSVSQQDSRLKWFWDLRSLKPWERHHILCVDLVSPLGIQAKSLQRAEELYKEQGYLPELLCKEITFVSSNLDCFKFEATLIHVLPFVCFLRAPLVLLVPLKCQVHCCIWCAFGDCCHKGSGIPDTGRFWKAWLKRYHVGGAWWQLSFILAESEFGKCDSNDWRLWQARALLSLHSTSICFIQENSLAKHSKGVSKP